MLLISAYKIKGLSLELDYIAIAISVSSYFFMGTDCVANKA